MKRTKKNIAGYFIVFLIVAILFIGTATSLGITGAIASWVIAIILSSALVLGMHWAFGFPA